ncbi:MAG: adenosine-specific kinase [Candidatus Omnitrophica bacterium]|nr:adenosine-specific kinase [Candidatus Omnitrophota bacterium]
MEIKAIKIIKPQEVNVIIGQAHFIKTVEDLYEVMVTAVPGLKFGIAFCESSGACKVRVEGNSDEMNDIAVKNALAIAAGHVFVVAMTDGFPINVLNQIKNIQEVCTIFAATANSLEVIIADNGEGRGILGVIDGVSPKGVEGEDDVAWRKSFLRKIGYKR